MVEQPLVEISGAGPAGLAAALAVIRAGGQARVYERRADVGLRFHGDFQGLENWTTEWDVLEELDALGISPDFKYTPFSEVVCFGPGGIERRVRSRKPIFYLVRRGDEAGTIDHSLKQQALTAGAEIRFEAPLRTLPHGGVVTEGPHRADAIAAGYLFETDLVDGAYAVVSDELAAKGYGYLLVCKGRGTLATCLFDDFHHERQYLERCVEFFTNKVGVHMKNPRHFGGSGNFSLPRRAHKGNILYAGEAAGFQDPLFGFGIRWALLSGAAAGRALAVNDRTQYEAFWRHRMRDFHKAAASNRWFYNRLGNNGYRRLLEHYPDDKDIRESLRRFYTPKLWKSVWYHLAAARQQRPLLRLQEDCDCTWCRCARHSQTA